MSVIKTDQWLLDSYDKPIEICEKLSVHFAGAEAIDIYKYLTFNGMYHPIKDGTKLVKRLQKNKAWELIRNEQRVLQKLWEGPNIPIFIFPSDTNNRKIVRDFNGKSGLAFKDKLFLFISEANTETELKALFTHEYNHVCRLSNYQKNEEDYVLLDSVILEGLAENAVRERFGEEYMAPWASYYSNNELEKMWRNFVLPNRNIPKINRKHDGILFGLRFYPKMLGYCVGYYLVKQYLEKKRATSKELFHTETDKIAQLI